MRLSRLLRASLFALCAASPAFAATVSDTFDVTLTIQPGCEVTAANNLDFGTISFLDTAITQSVDFTIRCSSGTNGTISLDDGSGASGTVTLRTLESGANSVQYGLYTSAAYSTYWGDGTGGSSTVIHNGTGSATNLTIYGQIPLQGLPPAGTYSDTVTVTVTY
jgi:spore coat protein U-like protein